jgi:hypothetical protein
LIVRGGVEEAVGKQIHIACETLVLDKTFFQQPYLELLLGHLDTSHML